MNPHNYIFWPVLLNGAKHHITLKYLGDVDVTPEQVTKALSDFANLLPGFYEWKPEIFEHNNEVHYVLEWIKLAPLARQMHDAVEHFRSDDFPIYRPHITVTKAFWDEVNTKKSRAVDFDFLIGLPQYRYNGTYFKLVKL